MKIFVIDDEAFMREAIQTFLKEKFPEDEVITFETGENALQHIYQKPDVIFLDFYLNLKESEAQNGIEILKQIKNILPDTPVIMLSSQDSVTVAADTIKYGAYDYIVKSESAFARLQILLNKIHGYNQLNKRFEFQRIMNIVLAVLLAGLLIGMLAMKFYT